VTLVLTAQMRMDAAQTKGELEATKRGIQGVTAATAEQATKSRAAAGAADAEAAAKRRNAQASRELTTANRGAAGATGNLVAQFNDIGMMLAAGQNPLQLAIQQGSQITQVIGPMGAAGAARALGGAFLGMLNPLSLITMGVIAFGAAAVQWLFAATEDSAELTAEFDRQKEALEGIVAETEKLRLARAMALSGAKSEDEQIKLEEIKRLTAERIALQATISANEDTIGGKVAMYANQEAQARRAAAAARIAEIDAVLQAFNRELELTAESERQQRALIAAYTVYARTRVEAEVQAAAEQERAMTVAHDLYARTRQESDLLADAASRAGVEAASLATALGSVSTAQLAAASSEALRLAANLGIALDVAERLAALGPQGIGGNDPSGGTYSGRGRGPTQGEIVEMRLAGQLGYRTPPKTIGAGGGGGAAAARDEADALQELITSLEAEIAALRESDPVQKELLQHRKAMEGATEAERLKVEELIATREREKAAMEAIQELQQFKEDLVEGALDSLIAKGQSLKEVLDQVIIALMKAIIQAAIFGSGPLGSMFGGGGIGALIFGGGKAEGGMVHGPGTGTSDSVLTPLSNGEYVVNARATAQNRHLLEAINSGGRIPGFAQGGYVGTDNRRMAARGEGGGDTHIHMHLAGAKGDREIEMLARKGTEAALKDYDRNAAPATVRRVSSDPRRTG
jgi:hypothetical protein